MQRTHLAEDMRRIAVERRRAVADSAAAVVAADPKRDYRWEDRMGEHSLLSCCPCSPHLGVPRWNVEA